MSLLIYEAAVIGCKEALKIGVVWIVFNSYLIANDRKNLIKPFYLGVLVLSLVSVLSLFLPHSYVFKEYLGNLIATSFSVIFLLSAVALFHASGVNLFGPVEGLRHVVNRGMPVIIFLTTILLFSPDSIGSILFLRELSVMKETEFMTYLSACGGFFITIGMLIAAYRYFEPYWIGGFFDMPQLLLFLAIVKLLGSGIQGFAELSLIPSVQRGLMKFFHDVVHQTFVFLMVPDHPLLKTTVWNFIAFFFDQSFASWVSLLVLLLFPLLFIYYSLLRPVPEPEAYSAAQRRKTKSRILHGRRKKAVPVLFFICLILVSWSLQRGESVSRLYNPEPEPVVADKGILMIPLSSPTRDLMDGALHKFSLTVQDEEIRLMIIKRSDNTLSVCLDACEICPPKGYGQREGHVVCIYCNTPIPIDTLGQPGGCNPIPLTAAIYDRFVRIELSEIIKKWEYVKSGKSKESIH